jgi:hypothetical protein
MQIDELTFASILALTVVLGAGAHAAATKIAWTWDMKLEAVNAAPKIHKILFENDRLRLLEVTIHAGEQEPMHGHQYPSVFAFDAPQPNMENEQLDGSKAVVNQLFMDGDLPQCRSMPVQPPHRVTINDSFQQHFYRLEFKKVDGADILKRP